MITAFIMLSLLGAIDGKKYASNHAKIGQYEGIADPDCGRSCNQVVAKCVNCSKGRSLKRGQKSAKLTNADTASVGEFPWMASLQSNKTKRHFCSGTVINSNWIITAAHCFKVNQKVDSFYIRTGSIKVNSGVIESAHQYYIHPKYNISDMSGPYDLALVYVRRVSPKKRRVVGICLPERDIQNEVNENAYYSGFGRIHYKGLRAKHLMKSEMTLLPDTRCSRHISKYNMACLKSSSSHTCKGDSGSPLIQYVKDRAVLIGIHKGSTKTRGKCGRDFAVTTRVSKFMDWIVDTIRNHQNDLDC